MWGIELAVMGAMILFNGVFAAYEIALASISAARLHALVGTRVRGAASAEYMKRNMEGSLAGVQLGITLVGAVAAAVGGAGAEEKIAPLLQRTFGLSSGIADLLAIATVVAPLTVVTIIFGELIPKVFALRNKEWVCLRLSPAMHWFVRAVWPIVAGLEGSVTGLMRLAGRWLGDRIDRSESEASELHELHASVALARTSRLIGPREEKIILAAAALSHRPLREVMLPAEFMSMLDADASLGEALIAAHLDMHTRFPVAERGGDPQSVIGYVNFKDLVAFLRLAPRETTVRGIARSILRLSASEPVATGLEHLIRERTHIALVQDESERVVGMVTLEDIIEELVGDIEDEFDSLPTHLVQAGSAWVAGGGVSPDKLQSVAGLKLVIEGDERPIRHLSDWVLRALGQTPRGGEVIDRDGLRVVVRKVRRQMVQEAQVESAAQVENAAQADSTPNG
ncbi:MAG TPA: hemolysin family protein [Pirellulaceae bacterium]|nr:hemolysin family protein [Pirellulaceae bacterium]